MGMTKHPRLAYEQCQKCDGDGIVSGGYVDRDTAPGDLDVECDYCDGAGNLIHDDPLACPECGNELSVCGYRDPSSECVLCCTLVDDLQDYPELFAAIVAMANEYANRRGQFDITKDKEI